MWIIFAAILLCGSAAAMSDAEVKAEFIKTTMSCMKEHPVEMTDLVKLKSYVLPNNRDVMCLLACTYRKYGTLNADGKFDLDVSYKLAEKTKAGEPESIANGKKLTDVCIKVNDQNVSDGSTGCERAGLMFACFVENAPKLGFTL